MHASIISSLEAFSLVYATLSKMLPEKSDGSYENISKGERERGKKGGGEGRREGKRGIEGGGEREREREVYLIHNANVLVHRAII